MMIVLIGCQNDTAVSENPPNNDPEPTENISPSGKLIFIEIDEGDQFVSQLKSKGYFPYSIVQ